MYIPLALFIFLKGEQAVLSIGKHGNATSEYLQINNPTFYTFFLWTAYTEYCDVHAVE
jgi:hypothetical protein